MVGGLSQRYRDLVVAGKIDVDPAQELAAGRLQVLSDELVGWRPASSGILGWFRGKPAPPPRGLYIHGAVGRGKTMLMDLFFVSAPFAAKLRLHFHQFMADVHDRIADARKTVAGDPIPAVADAIAKETRLLCFDELHVTDIADAMILGRLFAGLFARDVVVVATSNARPDELYRNGLNRQLFLPFIDLIEDHMDVLELKAAKDFRLEKLAGQPLYFSPLGPAADTAMDAAWQRLLAGAAAAPTTLDVKGRALAVPRAALGIARFDFAQLCESPLGNLDFIALANAFHMILLDHIPILSPERRNAARRLINLVDTLYDRRVGLIASADAEPDRLYVGGDGSDLFQRTASRMIEMRSESYLSSRSERARLVIKTLV